MDAASLALIALAHLTEPGNRDLFELVAEHGPVDTLDRLSGATEPGRDDPDPRVVKLCSQIAARCGSTRPAEIGERALEHADRLGVRIITPEQADWPTQLTDLTRISRDVSDPIQRDTLPPHCLWVRGGAAVAEICDRAVAVVGARASTSYGEHVAAELGHGLASREWTVVSGGAFGVDAAAHRGALAARGATVAVQACGIDRTYPFSHASLFDRIGEEGLLLSEWPPGSDPHRRRFLIRNRVIAALTRGTVMVEANLRSGARFTLNRARELSRAALVVPGPITSAMSAGCHEELRVEGTILVASVEHVIEAVGRLGVDLAPVARAIETPRDQLTDLQQQILDGVRPRKVLTAEEIAAAAGATARDARRTLPGLELAGFIEADKGGYRLARPGRGDSDVTA